MESNTHGVIHSWSLRTNQKSLNSKKIELKKLYFLNKTVLDKNCLISNSTNLGKSELSLKRETMSEVYVSSMFTHLVTHLKNELAVVHTLMESLLWS